MDIHAPNSAAELIAQWYRTYRKSVYLYIRSALRCGHEEAEDQTQEVFKRAYYSLKGQPEPIAYPKRWLLKFAKNVCLQFRTDSSHNPVCLPASYMTADGEEGSLIDDVEAPSEDQPENVAEQREALQQVYAILETFPPEQRQAVLLHYRDGYSFNQIAEKHPARKPRTICQDAHKGMEHLKVRLNELEY